MAESTGVHLSNCSTEIPQVVTTSALDTCVRGTTMQEIARREAMPLEMRHTVPISEQKCQEMALSRRVSLSSANSKAATSSRQGRRMPHRSLDIQGVATENLSIFATSISNKTAAKDMLRAQYKKQKPVLTKPEGQNNSTFGNVTAQEENCDPASSITRTTENKCECWCSTGIRYQEKFVDLFNSINDPFAAVFDALNCRSVILARMKRTNETKFRHLTIRETSPSDSSASNEPANTPAKTDHNTLKEETVGQQLHVSMDNNFIVSFWSIETKGTSLSGRHLISQIHLFENSILFPALIRDQDALALFPLTRGELLHFAKLLVAFHDPMSKAVESHLIKLFSRSAVEIPSESSSVHNSAGVGNDDSTLDSQTVTSTNPTSINESFLQVENRRNYERGAIDPQTHIPHSRKKFVVRCFEEMSMRVRLIASLVGQQVPQITLPDYLDRLMQYGHVECHEVIIALILISRLLKNNPEMGICPLNAHRLLLTACTVTTKVYKDSFFGNFIWSQIGGIKPQEMNQLEIAFLQLVNYRTHVLLEQFSACYCLVKRATSQGEERINQCKTMRCNGDTSPEELSSQIFETPYSNLLFFEPAIQGCSNLSSRDD
ncbi:hypothetical protein IE077_003003 [Cardiosporidium cionae]|uniref:Cyclin N-terminal domain-containing protein n=1 Tax=Cardiosporidium cionae TaxID=476202 RepID=A0ABQ7JAC2_9APIC|nr:hypothetical protein IE077_003003 [Cardiosporidium cionae]|eukprot:KAF8820600.1 hypothetical protein IE077_003003 [Cardiosporidium cionae]